MQINDFLRERDIVARTYCTSDSIDIRLAYLLRQCSMEWNDEDEIRLATITVRFHGTLAADAAEKSAHRVRYIYK